MIYTQIKPLQMAFGRTTNFLYLITYYLLTYWHRLALFNSNTLNLMMLWWLMKSWVSASVMLLFGLQNLCV